MSEAPHAYDLLKTIIHLSNASLPFESKLTQMLHSVSGAFQSEPARLFLSAELRAGGLLSRVAAERKRLWVEDGPSFSREGVLPEEEDLLRPSFACLPLCDDVTCYGVLHLGFRSQRSVSPEERELLTLVAAEIKGPLREAHRALHADQAHFELTALRELGNVATATLKLDDLLQLILMTGARILKAKGGALRLTDKETGGLTLRSNLGEYDRVPLADKIARRVLATKAPLAFNLSEKEAPFQSVLCTPLVARGSVLGTLTYYDMALNPSSLDPESSRLLLTSLNQISCCIENALSHVEMSDLARIQETRAKRLSVLWELNKALLTTVNFDRVAHLVLTAVTIGDGLGFNRAMLFLVNEKEQSLEGVMAVGPESAEEAGKIWNALSEKKGALSELLLQLSPSSGSQTALEGMIRGICIPLDRTGCILSRTVLEERPFNIQMTYVEGVGLQGGCDRGCHLTSGTGCFVGAQLSRNPQVYAYATVPLWGKGKAIGAILVDNLFNRRPIGEDDIEFLSMFAHQAGLAIENAMVYRNLEAVQEDLRQAQALLVHREKMAALGELSNTIAHQIKNPLVAVGGFARRLYRAVRTDGPEKRYAQTIMVEVSRLERILTDMLQYSGDESPFLREYDLRNVLEDSLSMVFEGPYEHEIQVMKDFGRDLPKMQGDDQQLRQAFFHLFANACEAMKGQGVLRVSVHLASKNGSSYARIEVKDAGRGIDPENLDNIFNPFYSTKENGLGLGLPIVHKIITSHGGKIEVDNHPGQGTTFIITLPVREDRGVRLNGRRDVRPG